MAGRIKGVAFDLNGTLVDSVEQHVRAWARAFKRNGFHVEEAKLRPFIGLSSPKVVRAFVGNVNDQIMEKVDTDYKTYFGELINEIKAFPEAPESLSSLRRAGIKIAVASSSELAVALRVLEQSKLRPYADALVGGDEVLLGKPDPEIYIEAFRRIEVTPRMGAVVGDTEYDTVPAHRIGALAIAVQRAGKEVKSADLIFASLADAVAEILGA